MKDTTNKLGGGTQSANDELKAVQRRLQTAKAELARSEHRRLAIENSTSWRITAPLRHLTEFARAAKRMARHNALLRLLAKPLLKTLRPDSTPVKHASAPVLSSASAWDTRLLPSVTCPAEPKIKAKKIYIVPATLSERNTTRYRVHNFKELFGISTEVEIVDLYKPESNFLSDIEEGNCVVVLQRIAVKNKAIKDFLEILEKSGSLVVYEIDDQIFDAGDLESWRLQKLEPAPEKYMEAMKYADHFIVSTVALRNRVENLFRKPVHVVHNCLGELVISASLEARKGSVDGTGPFIIGYASGSATHDEDLEVALSAVAKFLASNAEAQFHCIGHVEIPPDMQANFGSRIRVLPPVPWGELPAVLATFSVQIIPLAYAKFNKFKSHIRFLESAAVGVPVIASNIGEQAATIINGHTGLLVSNEEGAWFDALSQMYGDRELRAAVAENAFSFVSAYWTTTSRFQLYRVRQIVADLSLGVMTDKVSIVLVVYNPVDELKKCIESLITETSVPFELLIWNNSPDNDVKNLLKEINEENALIIDTGQNVGKAKAANYLFGIASERFVCGLDDDYAFPPSWDFQMLMAAKTVPNLGWLSTNLSLNSSGMRGKGRTDTFPGGASVLAPDAVGGWVVFTSATARARIGKYHEHGLYGGIDADYNRRAQRAGMYTGYVRRVVGRHKTSRAAHLAWELHKQRIQDEMRVHGKTSDKVIGKFKDFFADSPQPLSVALKICTSTTHNENVWGDTHFANGLKSALEKLAYNVRIDKHEEWYGAPATDVVIHLFGLHKFNPDSASINVLWIISHPDLLDEEFVSKFDYIFCASDIVSDMVRSMAPNLKVETLHQCTNADIFVPDAAVVKDIDVAFVGNSRNVFRSAVRYAVGAGFDVKVWGTRWEQFIDRRHIQEQSIGSSEVADIYRRSKVVLNDHWDDQNMTGLVNNRIFDVLACGTCVLSDYNSGIPEVFGNKLPTYTNEEEFVTGLTELLNDKKKREGVAKELGSLVRDRHNFDLRAKRIHESVAYVIENYVEYKSERQWTASR